jgi:hypothetical protein
MDEPMTVKQLMEELKQMDEWAEVHIERYDKIGSTRYELHTFENRADPDEFILYFR